jgi:hypothetical protein
VDRPRVSNEDSIEEPLVVTNRTVRLLNTTRKHRQIADWLSSFRAAVGRQ